MFSSGELLPRFLIKSSVFSNPTIVATSEDEAADDDPAMSAATPTVSTDEEGELS